MSEPNNQQEVLDFINSTPRITSVLYDLNLMPEQVTASEQDQIRMLAVARLIYLLIGAESEAEALRKELGRNTDEPSPTGSVYALKNYWKQEAEVAMEEAGALREIVRNILPEWWQEIVDDDRLPDGAIAVEISNGDVRAIAQALAE